MIKKFDRNDRRILNFPAVNPCEGISPATLLESLINLSRSICNYQSKFFATQKKNARETIREIGILLIFFEEIRDHVSNLSDSVVLCFSELHVTFQKIQFLLEDCTREGARFWILMKSHFVATQFLVLIRAVATALDVLPLSSIDVSGEIRELVELVAKQARKVKMEEDVEDDTAMKRVILILNQFENRFEPEPFMIQRVLNHLGIRNWADCHREIKFLEQEIGLECMESEERELPLVSNLLGFLCYCRGVIFQDCDFRSIEQSDPKSNMETLSCLNPEDFRCPISLELMTDPVTVSTGQTYDRASIQKWLKSGNLLCPKTGEILSNTELVPNTNLRKVIQQFCAEYGISMAKSWKINRDISRTILPGSPAAAQTITFLSEFLALMLSYGTDYQKNKAAHEVRLLAKSNIFNRSCLIEHRTIPPLLELVTSTDDPLTQENAISALLKLSKHANGKKAIVENGGVKVIVKVLKTSLKMEARQIAAAMIFYLSSVHEYRKLIGEKSEAIPALLELINEGTTCGKRNAVVAIYGLMVYEKNQQKVLASGAVPILVSLMRSVSKPEIQIDTLAALAKLAENVDGSTAILQASALPLVLSSMQTMTNRAGKEYCVSILHSLCIHCGADVIPILAKDSTVMPTLYALLTEGTSQASKKSRSLIKALQRFCETSSSRLIQELRQEQFVGVR